MKKALLTQFLFLLCLFTPALSMADANSFKADVRKSQRECPRLNCAQAQVHLETISVTEYRALPAELREKLREVAFDLAQVWGDTILEGDFEAHHQIKLDTVEFVVEGSSIVGYRLTYSASAKEVSTGREGRIVESGFVHKSFRGPFRDNHSLARFMSEAKPRR
ncbi:MAG: hypothetical protein LW875_06980 [Proteobacteria bacterium]|jgi:hypothetical protein|nr:hypothetical protein [Pseudomonadota bacterium]